MPLPFVFLDAAGTLIHLRRSVGEVYAEIASLFGVQREPQALEEAFRRHFHRQGPFCFPGAAPEDTEELERRWWRSLVLSTFGGQDQFQEFGLFFDHLYDAFSDSRRWELFDETRDALAQMTQQGFRLGVLSNFDSRLNTILQDLEILDYFECVCLSSRLGAAKPSPEIFETAAHLTGCPPHAHVHVGDSLEDDFRGARNSGWKAFLLDRRGSHLKIPSAHRLRNLSELPARLAAGSSLSATATAFCPDPEGSRCHQI